MKEFVEKYAVQPICYDQSIESIYNRLFTIERHVFSNLYHFEPLAYIVSKCFVVESRGNLHRVVFAYNPKYGFVYNAPVFDKDRNIFLNSYVTSNVYDAYEDALDECDKKNSMLIDRKVLESREEDYETAYKNEKMKVENLRFTLDSYLRETNGLETSHTRSL